MRKRLGFSMIVLFVSMAGCGVNDEIPPYIDLKGPNPLELYLDQPYVEYGLVVRDDIDGEITVWDKVPAVVPAGTPGTYTVTYTAEDEAGNVGSAERTVVVLPEKFAHDGLPTAAYSSVNTQVDFLTKVTYGLTATPMWEGTRMVHIRINQFPLDGTTPLILLATETYAQVVSTGTVPITPFVGSSYSAYVVGGGEIDLASNTLELNLSFQEQFGSRVSAAKFTLTKQ